MLASVMAKKFAVSANLVVIDIPVGQHTKVPTLQEGRKPAREFIELGEHLSMKVERALTYGDIPAGLSIGPRREETDALNRPFYKYYFIFRQNGVCGSQNHYPAFTGSGSRLEMYDVTLEEMNT
jgi:hypothetical protein